MPALPLPDTHVDLDDPSLEELPMTKLREVVRDLRTESDRPVVAHSKHSKHSKYGRW